MAMAAVAAHGWPEGLALVVVPHVAEVEDLAAGLRLLAPDLRVGVAPAELASPYLGAEPPLAARLQTVDRETNALFHALLSAFDRLTGTPVLINTSFNVRGEPIVCTPADALACFNATGMDRLVIDRFVLRKEAQPGVAAAAEPPPAFAHD